MRYFEWAEAVHMGLDRFDHECASTVVASLKSTWCGAVAGPHRLSAVGHLRTFDQASTDGPGSRPDFCILRPC